MHAHLSSYLFQSSEEIKMKIRKSFLSISTLSWSARHKREQEYHTLIVYSVFFIAFKRACHCLVPKLTIRSLPPVLDRPTNQCHDKFVAMNLHNASLYAETTAFNALTLSKIEVPRDVRNSKGP